MIGLGCMRLSTDAARDPARGRAVLEAAIAAGVALLDTADAYALADDDAGHNERLIAEAVAGAGRRVEIVTKGGLVRPGGAWIANGRASHLAAAARASRDRLGVAAIDLYLLHAIDPRTPLATSVRALARLRDDGVVARVGLSNVHLLQLEAALAIVPIDAVEVELSPFKLDAIRGGLVAACDARGIRVLAHRPLGGPAGVRRIEADPVIRALAARAGATPVEVILAWLTTLSPMIVPLPGATRVETAASAARAQAVVLDDAARAALAARFLALVPDAPPTTLPGHRTLAPAPAAASGERTAAPAAASGERTAAPAPASGERTATPAPASGERTAAPAPASGERTAAAAPASGERTPAPAPASGERTAAAAPAAAATSGERTVMPVPTATSGERTAMPADDPGEIVIIMGMPASGKSTLAIELAARGYLRLNRDDRGGTLIALARQLGKELAHGIRRVVIDNTYASRASRAPIVALARRHGVPVRCVVMATSLEDAQANAVTRILARHGRLLMPADAPGAINELARAREVDPRALFRFRRDHEPPRADEGFAVIEHAPFVRAHPAGGRPALIVELDDVVWRGRPRTPDAIALVPGARDALAAWSAHHAIAATTWQPGLARIGPLVARLSELLELPLLVMHCAHPAGPPVCWCRKPLPGLAFALAHAHGLDLTRALHVGKGPADRGFAARAGVRYADVSAGWPTP